MRDRFCKACGGRLGVDCWNEDECAGQVKHYSGGNEMRELRGMGHSFAQLTHGKASEVAALLDNSADTNELRAALINAMTRIDRLEKQIEDLTGGVYRP